MNGMNIVKSSYIRDAISKGNRSDSRGIFDIRDIKIEANVLINAEGSSRVRLGKTDVMAGVKAVIEMPHSDTPNEGNLVVSAELLPLASADFAAGPPSPEAVELARVVDRGIRAGECIDLGSLFLEEDKIITLYVDVYVLDYDGNLFDACNIAAMNALMNVKLPKYENGVLNYNDRNIKLKMDNTVISTTFGKFGDVIILDMDGNEEEAADARLTITTDGKSIRAMQKGLNGGFTTKQIDELVGISLEKYDYVNKYIKSGG